MADWLQKQWKGYSIWHLVLLPLSFIFFLLSITRKWLFRLGVFRSDKLLVPVIVIGNISVGGTGKTPLVIWLVEQLRQKGFKPGVISRGYGRISNDLMEVFAHSSPSLVGDEPLLIAKRTKSPVFVSANRVNAGNALLKGHPEVDVIVSDDGLQHYRMQRDIEIAAVDAERGFGNHFLLPAGPLRELRYRLNSVDAIVMTNADKQHSTRARFVAPVFDMDFNGDVFVSLFDDKTRHKSNHFNNKQLVAIAGIANPKRFFDALTKMGLVFEQKSYADHYAFKPQDFLPFVGKTILMTEKDAVKCAQFAKNNALYDIWMMPVSASIDNGLNKLVLQQLARLSKGK